MPLRLTLVALVTLFVSAAFPVHAERLRHEPSTDPLTVELLTMGPGEHPFFKFGHNAIRIRNERTGSDSVYNYGTFSFDSPTLIRDFFKGRLQYWLSRESMAVTLAHYADEQRSLTAQRLELSHQQKYALKRLLDRNAQPEHRAYKYDYFFDNCSTRLRDALDSVTDGQLRARLQTRARQSLRDHALRATADHFLEYLVLSIGLGPLVDRPASRWQEAFLPEMLADVARQAKLRQADGSEYPLVISETALLEADVARLTTPPRWELRFFAAGCTMAMVWVALSLWSRRSRAASAILGVLLMAFGTLVGLLGCALASLWIATDHAVAYRNQNLLVLSPLAFALAWFAPRLMTRGLETVSALRWVSLALFLSCLMALLVKVIPFERQDNANLVAFFLPTWFALWCVTAASSARTAAKLRECARFSTRLAPKQSTSNLGSP